MRRNRIQEFVFAITINFVLCISSLAQASNFAMANNINIHYLEWGKGEKTIVLIHGLFDTAEIWKDFAPLLAKNYRVIAPDRRGSGKSEKPLKNYDTQTLATDVKELLDALNIKKATIIGHSFGGNTAMKFAADFSEKTENAILIEGGFWKKGKPAPLAECLSNDKDCLIANLLLNGSNKYDAEKLYPQIKTPMLLILGLPKDLNKPKLNAEEKENKKFFDEALNYLKDISNNKIGKGKSIVIKDAGHWVFKNQPNVSAIKINKFIKANESRRNK